MSKSRKLRVEVSIRSRFPPSYRPLLRKAAQATVDSLPAWIWKENTGNRPASLSISIVGKAKSKKLNATFRKKDRPTDVLSFPSAATPGSDFLGDLVICWAVAESQTADFHTTPSEEVQRLVVHGVLHLVGYDHERSAAESRLMFALQEKILRKLRR